MQSSLPSSTHLPFSFLLPRLLLLRSVSIFSSQPLAPPSSSSPFLLLPLLRGWVGGCLAWCLVVVGCCLIWGGGGGREEKGDLAKYHKALLGGSLRKSGRGNKKR